MRSETTGERLPFLVQPRASARAVRRSVKQQAKRTAERLLCASIEFSRCHSSLQAPSDEGGKMRKRLGIGMAMLLAFAGAAQAGEADAQLAKLKAVGREGAGNVEAS